MTDLDRFLDALLPGDEDPDYREAMRSQWEDEPASSLVTSTYWQRRREHFCEVLGWLAEDGFAFDPDTPVSECVATEVLFDVFGELTNEEVALLFGLSHQRVSSLVDELLAWLRLPMHHALNRDVTVASIRKHLRQQELIF